MKMVEGKPVIINGKETQYFLFKNGDLYNENTHRIAQGAINQGYIRFTLEIDGETIGIYKHQLMAQLFIPNPENKPIVHHKDGCPRNNTLDNLEWVSQEENLNKIINPVEHKITEKLTLEELEEEEWRPLQNSKYEVSNMGRIKNLQTGKITFGSRNKNSGYIRWTYNDLNGNRQEIQAHRAVYMVFHPDEKINVINHIDSNRGNNRLSNLENVSQRENVIKSYYQTKTKQTKLTGQYDLEMNLIQVFPSTSEAAKNIGLNNCSNLSRAMKTGGISHGYYWREISKAEYDEFLNKK
jgi:hypothetical protein